MDINDTSADMDNSPDSGLCEMCANLLKTGGGGKCLEICSI